ncbi:sugar-binding transcriptional regulator [Microbacterium sp. PMB16]|uniref:sugar-binding transcriptional regulator n=1 Tax=Microbacterium sp. PMB16 TaxID=3120157 RepID=UPI003F4B7251
MKDDFSDEMLASVARRFYLEDASKVEIAAEHGVSRFKVARMLQAARETGVVSIELHDRADQRVLLARQLADHLGLEEVRVVPNGGSDAVDRERMALEAARLVSRLTRPGDTIGISWGRTIVSMTSYLHELPQCTVAQLTGTVGNDVAQSPIEVLYRLSALHPLTTVGIFAPLFAASAATAGILRAEGSIATALATYDRLTTAVVSIGSWEPRITQLEGFLDAADLDLLESGSAVAEIAGTFIDAGGATLDLPLNDRRIAVDLEQLRATPHVIAAAGSLAKVDAIRAAVSSGILTVLIVDEAAARALLQLPPTDSVRRTRRREK